MLTNEQLQQVRPRLLAIQIVSGILMLSVLAFAGAMSMIVDWALDSEGRCSRCHGLTGRGAGFGYEQLGAASPAVPEVF